jgi:hypothetical protein
MKTLVIVEIIAVCSMLNVRYQNDIMDTKMRHVWQFLASLAMCLLLSGLALGLATWVAGGK